MADNISVKDSGGAAVTVRTTDNGGVHTPHHIVDNVLGSSTGTRSQVPDTASDTLILAANPNRRRATVYNDSSALLYLGLGTTAVSSTNYTVRVYPNGYFVTPVGFTGQIRGIWASDPDDGAARVTELT